MLRLFVDVPLLAGGTLALPEGAARHAQVRRVQPGDELVLFNGHGGEWRCRVLAMTRSAVQVAVESFAAADRELALQVTLAVGMPANERMDVLVEKATELGAACIQPLHCERSVLRLAGERAARKQAHWQALAVAACEQSGRTRVPSVRPVCTLAELLQRPTQAPRWLLSPQAALGPPPAPVDGELMVLSGPEGGLTAEEELRAVAAGFRAVGLGPRVLRAETAAVAVMAWLALGGSG